MDVNKEIVGGWVLITVLFSNLLIFAYGSKPTFHLVIFQGKRVASELSEMLSRFSFFLCWAGRKAPVCEEINYKQLFCFIKLPERL